MAKRSIKEIVDDDTFYDIGDAKQLREALREAREVLRNIQALVDTQAEDEGIWFVAEIASEAYLQAQLRELHTVIEAAPLLKKWGET